MANRKSTALAPRSRSAPRVVSPTNNTYVALPFSKLTVDQPVQMTVGDWISLAGLVVSVVGFSVVIWQFIRTANASDRTQEAIERDEPRMVDELAHARPEHLDPGFIAGSGSHC